MTWQLASILPIWVLVVIAAVCVGLFSTDDGFLTWLPIVLAGSVILAFAVQLAIRRKEGFVLRIMSAATGSVIILGAATAVLAAIA